MSQSSSRRRGGHSPGNGSQHGRHNRGNRDGMNGEVPSRPVSLPQRPVIAEDWPAMPDTSQDNLRDLEKLLNLLPQELSAPLIAHLIQQKDKKLKEIFLALGRNCELSWTNESGSTFREVFSTSPVGPEQIALFARLFDAADDSIRRIGVEGTLHRISRIMHTRRKETIGITARIGRVIHGVIEPLLGHDLIYSNKSLLLIGPPNVGKTTCLRELSRLLSQFTEDKPARIVCVVDKSNELGGDGLTPHPALGLARWLPVGNPSQQHQVLVEAVENHAPDVVIVDEVSSRREVEACLTIASRGVRIIATAHGRGIVDLINDRERCALVGGVQSDVLLSDAAAAKRADKKKSVRKRRAEPVFDHAVELHGYYDALVFQNVGLTVDLYLEGKSAPAYQHGRSDDGAKAIRTPVHCHADPNDNFSNFIVKQDPVAHPRK